MKHGQIADGPSLLFASARTINEHRQTSIDRRRECGVTPRLENGSRPRVWIQAREVFGAKQKASLRIVEFRCVM